MQLMQAEKLKSLGQLVAGVAHELNNPIGFVHALFEMAVDVMGRVSDVRDADAVAAAIAASNLETIVGKIAFDGAGLPPFAQTNICKTPLVGGQWRLKDGGYDLVIVDNTDQPSIPTGGVMEAIS